MFTGYSTVSYVVVLWLALEYFYFSYLIRIVVFINRYRSLYCCTVLSGKVSLQILLLWCISLFCPLFFFSFLVVGLVLQRRYEYLLLGVDTVLILRPTLFLFTVLWPLCGHLGNCSGLEVRHPRCVGSITNNFVYYTYSQTQLYFTY